MYYWNNSTTPTTSNTFQVSPGQSNVIVTVKVVYGSTETIKSLTIPVKSFDGAAPSIDGPTTICGSTVEYSIPGLRTGYTVQWGSSSGLSFLSQSDNSAIFNVLSSGPGYITAQVSTPCGGLVPLDQKNMWAGAPVINGISGPQQIPYGGNWVYSANVYGAEGATYQWAISPSLPLTSYGDNVQITFPSTNGDYAISLTVSGMCGVSSTYYYYVATGEYEPFIIFPNPSTGETTITLSSDQNEDAMNTEYEWDLEVYSESQTLKTKQTKLNGKSVKIQTSGWKEGVYIVRVKYKNKIFQEKLVVKK